MAEKIYTQAEVDSLYWWKLLGSYILTLAGFLLAWFSGGNEIPVTPEGWIIFVCSIILALGGAGANVLMRNKVPTKVK